MSPISGYLDSFIRCSDEVRGATKVARELQSLALVAPRPRSSRATVSVADEGHSQAFRNEDRANISAIRPQASAITSIVASERPLRLWRTSAPHIFELKP